MKKYLIMLVILGFIGNAIASQGVKVVTKAANHTQTTLIQLGE
jgi:hypothetical protein